MASCTAGTSTVTKHRDTLGTLQRPTGSEADSRHLWIRASNVVFRIRCSSGMGFLVIFSVGSACTC